MRKSGFAILVLVIFLVDFPTVWCQACKLNGERCNFAFNCCSMHCRVPGVCDKAPGYFPRGNAPIFTPHYPGYPDPGP